MSASMRQKRQSDARSDRKALTIEADDQFLQFYMKEAKATVALAMFSEIIMGARALSTCQFVKGQRGIASPERMRRFN